jgi:hypothetical protein
MNLLRLSREEFLSEFFQYRPGEHLAVIEPTGGGKTYLCYELLGVAMDQNPHLRVVSLMPKTADPATAQWAPRLGLRETPVWPPRRRLRDALNPKPRGWVLWPPHPMDLPPAQRRAAVGAVLQKGLDDQLRHGRSISFLDDAHSAATMMGLNSYLEEILVNGRSGGAAAWVALQKPSGSIVSGGVTSFVYSSPVHVFLGRDTEARNLRRLGEIGMFDARETEEIVKSLRLYQIGEHTVSEKLYLNRNGPYRCLVGP